VSLEGIVGARLVAEHDNGVWTFPMLLEWRGYTILISEDGEGLWYEITGPHKYEMDDGPFASVKSCVETVQEIITDQRVRYDEICVGCRHIGKCSDEKDLMTRMDCQYWN
jgi:hypothetical protein